MFLCEKIVTNEVDRVSVFCDEEVFNRRDIEYMNSNKLDCFSF